MTPRVAEFAAAAADGEVSAQLWVLIGGVILAILAIIGNIIVKRIRPLASEPERWKRLDELSDEIYGADGKPGLKVRVDIAERRAGAAGRVIRDLARQWPTQHIPRLNPADLDELDEETIPSHWRLTP